MTETEVIQPRNSIANRNVSMSQTEALAKFVFWQILTKRDPDGEQAFSDVKIDILKLMELLYYNNYRRFDIENDSIFIKIINNRIIKKIEVREMQDFVFDYVDNLPDELGKQYDVDIKTHVKKKLLHGIASFFNVQKLYYLKPKEPIKLNKDTMTEKFIYFENGVLKITSLKIDFIDYSHLSGYVWENEIIKRTYEKPRPDSKKDYVRRFFQLVSGENESRFRDLCIAAGYYAHDFHDYKLRALVLTDSGISEVNEANGRTGKTLFCRLIGGILSNDIQDASIKTYVEVNAKDFDPKAQFKYASCGLETKLIVLNDLKRDFDVDCIYNDITEGIEVNKKGLHAFKIRAKMILTTNKTIRLNGDSDTDRFLEFEFSNYFSKSRSPENEFKHWFFRDWNDEDYCRYYSFMSECIQAYFKNGCKLNEPQQINLNKRKLIEQTNEDFIEWIRSINIEPNKEYIKNDLFSQFVNQYPDYNNPRFKQKKFSQWLQYYCNFSPEFDNYSKDKNERRDSTNRYFIFCKS
jgi:hypothetical protein